MNTSTPSPIRRSQVLDELDVRFRPDGRRRIFSIKFVTQEGKLIFFPQAYACGAGRMNNKLFRVRGIQACDCKGNPEPGIHIRLNRAKFFQILFMQVSP